MTPALVEDGHAVGGAAGGDAGDRLDAGRCGGWLAGAWLMPHAVSTTIATAAAKASAHLVTVFIGVISVQGLFSSRTSQYTPINSV